MDSNLFAVKPVKVESGMWRFFIGHGERNWHILVEKRLKGEWEIERVLTYAGPYSAVLGARRTLRKILFPVDARVFSDFCLLDTIKPAVEKYLSGRDESEKQKRSDAFWALLDEVTPEEASFLLRLAV